MKKIYVIRKYIEANSALQAIKIEKKCSVDDCYIEQLSIPKPIEGFDIKKKYAKK